MDRIYLKFLKEDAEVLALPLCHLVNLSIKQSLFPDQCKTAKLKPLFKKRSKSDLNNFRPILLLPVVSKIIKKTHSHSYARISDKSKILHHTFTKNGCNDFKESV